MRQNVENCVIFQKHMIEEPGGFSEKTIARKIVKIEYTSAESGIKCVALDLFLH